MNASDFGILPSGSDQTTAINAALAACKGRLNFLGGTYVAAGLTGQSNVELSCEGQAAVFSNTTSSATLAFTNKSRFSVGHGIVLQGTAAAFPSQADSTQHGLVLDGCEDFDVSGLKVAAMSGSGIVAKNAPSWWTQAHLSDLTITGCYRGIHAHTNGEFLRVTNFGINRCLMGMDMDCGNEILSDGWLINNYTAMRWTGGSNHGHSLLENLIVDHNWYPLVCRDLEAGLSLSNCQILCDLSDPVAAPVIQVFNTRGLNITGGQIAANFLFDGTAGSGMPNRNGVNQVSGVYIRQPYAYTVAAPVVQNGATTPRLKENFTATGAWASNN